MKSVLLSVLSLPCIADVAASGAGILRLKVWPGENLEPSRSFQRYDKQSTFSGNHRLALAGDRNFPIYTEIALGTPPQFFRLILSTASSSLMVPNLLCSLKQCDGLSKYNSAASSTYKANGTKIGGSRSYHAFLSRDNMKLGDIEVPQQEFFEVTRIDPGLGGFDGYLGLAFPKLAHFGMTPPFYSLLNQGALAEPVFTLRLPSPSGLGQIVFGGIDPVDHEGEISYVPIKRELFWELELNAAEVGNKKIDLSDTTAIIDSHSPFIAMPKDMADLINRQIGAKMQTTERYTVDCRSIPELPDFKFWFGNFSLILKGEDYILNFDDEGCVSAFIGEDVVLPEQGILWLVGRPLLRRWFTVYHVGRRMIGFAEPA
ncbi:aspartyl protease [Ceratobasidium sp. AG-Ba]|nr:aspartyl protease [Ceratobasidium sp. AG-Ba]